MTNKKEEFYKEFKNLVYFLKLMENNNLLKNN
jgi:hypothetical protein